jgi:hypothetical protein
VRPETAHDSEMLTKIQYNDFWTRPSETPTMWLGLLYAALALGFRLQAVLDGQQPPDPGQIADSVRVNFYREKAVQCKRRTYIKCT